MQLRVLTWGEGTLPNALAMVLVAVLAASRALAQAAAADVQFSIPAGTPARPFDWRIQDVGAPQLQLEVTGLDALLERTARAGYRFLSVGAKPIERSFGRFVFVIDPDGVLVEFVEPAPSQASPRQP